MGNPWQARPGPGARGYTTQLGPVASGGGVERVAESGNLKVGLINLLQLFLVQGHGRTTHLLVRGNSWEEAAHVLGQL